MGMLTSVTKTLGQLALAAGLGAALTSAVTGCAQRYVMIQTGQFPEPGIYYDTLRWTREGGAAINTLHDFEQAQRTAYAGIGQLEGLHLLAPDDEDGLAMLNRAWASIAFAFIDDERELAVESKDERMVSYHEDRAKAAYKRSRFFGETLLEQRASGFKQAQRNIDTLGAWLKQNFPDKEHMDDLLWLGFSIVGTVMYDVDNPEAVAQLWVGVEILNHVARTDDEVDGGTVHTVLGAYHARSGMAELDEAKQHFDRALAITEGRSLNVHLGLAQRYYCLKGDQQNYKKTLQSILDAKDPSGKERLANAIAKRRAARYLNNPIWQEDCGFGG